jgi:hypothetical protein
MAKKEVEVDVDKEFSKSLYPVYPDQDSIKFDIEVDLPNVHLGTNRPVMLSLRFGSMEIFLKATNETNGKVYHTRFCSTK